MRQETIKPTARKTTTASHSHSPWPYWVGLGACAWSLLYGLLGLYWAGGGGGFPFGQAHDPDAALSILANVQAARGAPVIAALGLSSALLALVMTWGWSRGALRLVLLGLAWVLAVTLALLIPDYRVLVATAYAPIFLLGAPFGWPPVSFLEAIPWPVINQFLLIIGGCLWGLTALVYQRTTSGVCAYCGRTDKPSHWTTPSAAARWGRWAVYVAVLIPVLYAVTRWAWALGIPLGVSVEFLREGEATGMWWAGAALATVAVGGALLTLGLIQPWGERFPRWLPWLDGRRVPPALAIIPATLVAILVTTAGLMFVRLVLLAHFTPVAVPFDFNLQDNWATMGPELLWPLWGLALGAAALAYYYRRRGRCPHCGRGDRSTESPPITIASSLPH